MHLKRLVLQGYKTFATRTEFVFDTGVTAIVGPNGSGKSNVADALRWVLGEQSYRSLRGRQTSDMIFAGSGGRARAGMAQVLLTLDNSGGWLPIDFTEVEIGRRAYRSGENDYLINGQKVRLRDVLDLLATSGLAERTYTMIGQGLIDAALSLKADERRALFEEAAGISHYKARRAETLRRLQETERNLERVQDILAEIRPRLGALRRQANRARNYQQVAADLRHLLRQWYGYQWQLARQQFNQRRNASQAAEEAWEEGRRLMQAAQSRIGAQRQAIRQIEARQKSIQTARDALRDEVEAARRQTAVLHERQLQLRQQLLEIDAELPPMLEQQKQADLALQEAVKSLEAAQGQLGEARAALAQFNQSFAAQQAEIDHWRQAHQRALDEQGRRQRRLAQVEGQINQVTVQLEERRRDGVAATERETLQEELVRQEAQMAEVEARLTAVRQRKQTALLSVRQALDAQAQAQQALDVARREEAHQEQRVAGLEARLELLSALRQQATPLALSAESRLAALITIPPAFRVALEAVLAHRLDTLLLPDTGSLWAAIDALDPTQDLVAAVANDLAPDPPPAAPVHAGLVGRASDLVTVALTHAPLVALLLDRVFLADNVKAAYEMGRALPAGCQVVTRDGLIVHSGGLVERPAHDAQAGPLAREEAYREGSAAIQEAQGALAEAAANVARSAARLEERRQAVESARNEERSGSQAEAEANQELGRQLRRLEQLKQQAAYLARQEERSAAEILQLESSLASLEAELETGHQALSVLATALTEAETRLDALPVAEARQQRHDWQQQIESAQTIAAGRQAVVDSRRATLHQIDTQIRRLNVRRADLVQQQGGLALPAQQQALQARQLELEELDLSLTPLSEQLAEAQARLSLLEDEAGQAQEEAHELETQFTRATLALSQHETFVAGLRERIKTDLGLVSLALDDEQAEQSPLPLAGVVEKLPALTALPEGIEENIQDYRGQLQRLGGVNPEAPAEYEETQARYDFLTQQVEDLHQTELQLRQVIRQLDDLTSRAFAATVERVNQVFGRTFTQLFGGGAAELILTEPDDLTVSGVDILAQLPRRRQQGLALLSGGERSLTAAALIFSLLKVSPTPFCVMDEVDAMLDEANINRFRELLLELSRQTQFIVITHNRGTVQAAQTVYGISMGADSASQVISIRPEEYVAAPA